MFWLLVLNTIALPIPEKYMREAVATVRMIETQNELDKVCGTASPGATKLGCQLTNTNLIVTGNPCHYPEAKDPYSYARLMCHEKAHLNGWKHKGD